MVGLAGAAAFLFLFDPARAGLYAPCPFHALTGLLCPGCGSLRALHQLLHANLSAALALNPLMVLSIPFVLYLFWRDWRGGVARRATRRSAIPPWMIWSVLVIILAYGVLRNIPWYPFDMLAPH